MSQSPAAVHFPCLDELRFLAASAIVVLHTEQLKHLHGWANAYKAVASWSMAVTFFFVLSGFLITYLLLAERQTTGTISLRRFYVRRGLRIWPVYYLVVLSGLLVIPHLGAFAVPGLSEQVAASGRLKLVLFLTLLPNVAFVVFPAVPYAAQSWSIGAEEQFYFTWPVLVKYVKTPLPGMLGVVALFAGARIAAEHLLNLPTWAYFFAVTQWGSMAIGGALAYLLYRRKTAALRVLYHPLTQLGAAAGVLWIAVKQAAVPYVNFEVNAFLFGCLILNAAANPSALFRPRSALLARLGKWSYGIYMYHPLAIGLSIGLLGRYLGLDLGRIGPALLLYGAAFGLTVGLAYLSYRYLEVPVLGLRRYFDEDSDRLQAAQRVPTRARAAG